LEFNKEDFEILSEIDLGSEMKFESSDLNPNKGYLNSRQGFELKEFPNSERFKTFWNRKFGIWLNDSKFRPTTLKPRIFKKKSKVRIWISK
jgi:hypothetical protein